MTIKQYNNVDKISGESFFDTIPNNPVPLDKRFVSLDKSMIWELNRIFWKYFTLWEKTYSEPYEASLPAGISESHKDAFVEKSTKKFIQLLTLLEKKDRLPKKIIILEQGPGTGLYAKKFLDFLKIYSERYKKSFYKNTQYILSDTSQEILETAQNALVAHTQHVETQTLDATKKRRTQFDGTVLLARHSNVWDQFPVRLLLLEQGEIAEVLVRAVIDKNPGNVIANSVERDVNVEACITKNPLLWKSFVRDIKLQTKIKKLSKKTILGMQHSSVIQQLACLAIGKEEVVVSNAILDNIEEMMRLIDWQRNGYIEVVDIIVPTMQGFQKERRPKKYDGAIATVVNGPLIKSFLQEKQKHAQFEQIRGINYTVTMRNHTMQTLLDAKECITIGEIAVRRDEPIEKLKENTQALFTLGIDVVGFSDQAFVQPHYLSQREIVDTEIFRQLPGNALMPILKTRNKTWQEIQVLTKKLTEQGVTNLFVVTGDPGLEKEVLNTSIAITKKLKNDFFIGGVANAHIDNISKMKEKIQAGTKFFIMQATYDQKSFSAWVEEIRKQKIHEQVPIIAAIVPIVSRRTLSVLQFINDMAVSQEINRKFEGMGNDELRKEGISLAKEMVAEYKNTGIFSGIYIYSKSHEVICEIMGFPYQKTGNVNDSL